MVVEHRLDALLPLSALIGQRVPQPDPRAQIEHVIGRDPRLRQPPDHQQLAQMARVRAVAVGALLVPAPRGGLRRLGQVRAGADRPQFLNHEPPAGRRLQRDLQLPIPKPAQELPHRLAMRRRLPRPAHPTGRGIDPLGGDLPSMLVKTHYDRHTGPPQAPRSRTCADLPRLS
jgi:hypothetical protein